MNVSTPLRPLSALVALSALAAIASAQVIAPNVTYDGHDFDLTDGQCDAVQLTPGPQCTLRAALQHVQATGGAWTIQLGAATYVLTRIGTDASSAAGDLDVFSILALTIQGAGPATVIDASALATGGGPDRVLELVASLPTNVTVELRDLTLSGGRAGGFGGGGILHEGGRLLLTNVAISDCQAASSTGSGGGAVRTSRELIVSGGSFVNCIAGAPLASGGAILVKSGSQVTATTAQFFANSAGQKGGHVRVENGAAAALVGCSVGNGSATSGGGLSAAGGLNFSGFLLGNSASGSGGAIAIDAGGFVGLDASVLDNNTAQFGAGVNIGGAGNLDARSTTFRNNRATFFGGGISNAGRLIVERSTFAGNEGSGSGGGALYHFSSDPLPAVMNLCTLSGNRAPFGSGGGIHCAGPGPLQVSACTIVLNAAQIDGAGIYTDAGSGAAPAVKSSLFFDNMLTNGQPKNCGLVVPLPAGVNLDSDGTCLFGPGCFSGTTSQPLNPLIGPLAFNGGPTETHALLGCSPAIDAGDCNTVAGIALSTDQRMFPRFGNCDLGSYEAQPHTLTPEMVRYCFGTASACPCGIGSASGFSGCPNSLFAEGGSLDGTGIARISCDTVVLTATNLPNSSALLFQGTIQSGGGLGTPFGDGLRCAGGSIIRIDSGLASGNAISFPTVPGTLGLQGSLPTTGGERQYQVWYRNSNPAYCTVATFNLTNGLRIYWCP